MLIFDAHLISSWYDHIETKCQTKIQKTVTLSINDYDGTQA